MTSSEDNQALEQLLRRFTYRPGWRFSVERGCLRVSATVIDANNQMREAPLTFARALPLSHQMVGFDWTRWLFSVVMEIERHEVMEFFRVDGRPVYDPHPELAKVGAA